MADVKIVKSIYTGGDVTSLGEVTATDNVKLPGTFEVTGNSKLASVNKVVITEPATGATLALTDGKTLSVTQDTVLSGSPYTPGGTDVAITDGGTGASTAATAFANLKQAASETATGVAELATVAEAIAGTDTSRVVTPAGLAGHVAVARNPLAFAQGVALTKASSGSNGIQVADNANIDGGTNSISLISKVMLPDWTPSGNVYCISKWIGYILGVAATTGKLIVFVNAQLYTSSIAPNFTDGTTHRIAAVVTVGAANTTVDFYADGLPLGTQQTAAMGAPSISNAEPLYIMGSSVARYAGTVYESFVLNFAPTAAEMLDAHINGIPESWKWGSQTPTYTSDFSAGTDSFVASGVTLDGNIDYGGETDVLRLTADSSSYHTAYHNAVLVANKHNNAKLRYYIPSANAIIKQIRLYAGTGQVLGTYTVTDAWTDIDLDAIVTAATSPDRLYVYMCDSSGNITGLAAASGDVIYIKTVITKQVGATGAWESEGIQPAPGQWLDSSTNKNHAMQPASGSSLTRRMKTFEIRWTNTWAGTHEAQYIGGVNQAILPPNCYIEQIIGVISGATIEDIIIGDGSDTDRWVAITTGLAAGTVAFTIANRISDGTNYKMTVDPDANFTGSIAWTITGRILQ